MKSIGFGAILLALTACVAIAQTPTYHVAAVDAAPVIDGLANDACWQGVASASGFSQLTNNIPAEAQTRFAAVRDAANLYFFIVCNEPNPQEIKRTFTLHDESLWADDCVEIFLDPTGGRQEYAHIVVNAAGAVYDAWSVQGGLSHNSSYDTPTEAACQVNAWSWTAEVKIPFAALKMRDGASDTWAFNVAREKKTPPSQLSAWAYTGRGFHAPEKFATLTGMDADYSAFALEVPTVRFAHARIADNLVSGTVEAPVANWTGDVAGVYAEAKLLGADGTAYKQKIAADLPTGSCTLELPFKGVTPGQYMAEIRAKHWQTGALVAFASYPLDLQYAPLELEVLKPWYHNAIFSTCPVEEIVVQSNLRLGEKISAGAEMVAKLIDPNGVTVATQAKKPGTEAMTEFSFSASDLPYGDYHVVIAATAGGNELAQAEVTVRKLAPKHHEVCINENGQTLVDGQPFYPWGFMGAGPDEELGKAGYNLIHTYVARYSARDGKLTAWLDECARQGLQVVMSPYPGTTGFWGYNGKPGFTDEEIVDIVEYIETYRDHPALFGWYMCDEPRGEIWQAELARLAEIVRETDPYHPTIALDNGANGVIGLAQNRTGDIVWIDPYPGFGEAGPHVSMSKVFIAVDDIHTGIGRNAKTPVWIAPQAFSYGHFSEETAERAPTFLEARTMTYMALIGGVDGIVYYAWAYAKQFPELRVGFLQGLSQEMKALMPALNSGTMQRGEAMCEPEDAAVFVTLVEHEGDQYVIAANMTDKPCKAYVRAADLKGMYHVMSEARTVSVSGDGTLDDEFTGYATHIYTNAKDLPAMKTLDEIVALIERAEQEAVTAKAAEGE